MGYDLVKDMPKKFLHRFGCLHCSWRRTPECPVYDPEKYTMDKPEAGICEKRLGWLRTLLPPYETKPSFSQVVLDVRKGVGDEMLGQLSNIIKGLQKSYEALERDDRFDFEQLERIRKSLDRSRENWYSLFKTLLQSDDLAVSRETPKKLDVKVERKVTPADYAQLLKDATKQVDGKVIKE